MDKPANVVMEREGARTEVANNASVEIMAGLGWTIVPDETDKPSKGLNVEQLKEALTAKGIAFPDGAKKADLAALLDA